MGHEGGGKGTRGQGGMDMYEGIHEGASRPSMRGRGEGGGGGAGFLKSCLYLVVEKTTHKWSGQPSGF